MPNKKSPIKQKSKFKIVLLTLLSLMVLIIVVSSSYTLYIFNKENKDSTTLTAQQISKLTKYNPTDNSIITTIKTNALSENLATGSTELLIKLKNTELEISKIQNGTLNKISLKPKLDQLQKDFQLSNSQINYLETAYNSIRLKSLIDQLNKLSNSGTLTSMQDIQNTGNEIYATTNTNINNYIKDPNAEYPVYLNEVIAALNTMSDKLNNFNNFITLFNTPQNLSQETLSKFGELTNFTSEFNTQFTNLQTYVKSRDEINQHIIDLTQFKKTIDGSTDLIKNSIPTPTLIGKTIKQANDIAKDQFKLEIAKNNETNDSEVITNQNITLQQYDRIKKGSTLIIETKLKKQDPPVPSTSNTQSTESSSSTSSTSPSKSSTTSSTASSTNHSNSDVHDPNYNFDNKNNSTTEAKPK